MRALIIFCLAIFVTFSATGQLTTHQGQQALDQLDRLIAGKKILYVSFLPGQENTRLLTAAKKKYHYNTGVFWMSRGEGMHNYNGPERGIDLGVIHVAEMETAAAAAGYDPFVSSCKDLGARDTAAINATIPTDRLILDMAAVIRAYRPDLLIIGHCHDALRPSPGFNHWMDSICQQASQLAADSSQLDNKSLRAYTLRALIVDDTPLEQKDSAATTTTRGALPLVVKGMDSAEGKTYRQIAQQSQLAFRSVYPDLDSIAQPGDTAWLHLLKGTENRDTSVYSFFTAGNEAGASGIWQRLAAGRAEALDIRRQLMELQNSLKLHNYASVRTAAGSAAKRLKALPADPDRSWALGQLRLLQKKLTGFDLIATADKELGVLGQDFRLTVSCEPQAGTDTLASVIWLRVPGLIDSALPTGKILKAPLLLDTTLHIALMQEAYQPFWLNKPMRSDGSYNIDTRVQGQLSDTTSYHVEASIVSAGDTLLYNLPVYYRHFDRMAGRIRQPFYTIEPVLLAMTPNVLLTHVVRDQSAVDQKELNINLKTLFNDTAQVILFKVRQVGIEATVGGHKIQSDTASMVYQDAGYITPEPGQRTKVGIVVNQAMLKDFNPLTPILKPAALLKLPEGVQAFSSNIKTIGYPYQASRIYNYHSQTLIVADTIYAAGRRLLYLNGLSGDVFDNAFNQLAYKVQSAGFKDFSSLAAEVDLHSGLVPSFLSDSLQKLDAIVISGADESLPADSSVRERLRFLLKSYVQGGGRLVNLDPDPLLQGLLPAPDTTYSEMLIAVGSDTGMQVDRLSPLFNNPNKVAPAFFSKWEGLLSRGAILVQNDSTLYPIQIGLPGEEKRNYKAPVDMHPLGKGVLINCFIELTGPLSNGKAASYKFLANLLAGSSKK